MKTASLIVSILASLTAVYFQIVGQTDQALLALGWAILTRVTAADA